MNESLQQQILQNQNEMKDTLADVRERVARVEEKQEAHYQQNAQEHNQMHANVVDIKDRVTTLEDGHDEQQSFIDQRIGRHKLAWSLIGLVVVFVSGAAGYFTPKIIGWLTGG